MPSRFGSAVRRVVPPPTGPTLSDSDLLARFLDARDETAFEAIVARHLPAVRAVCRTLLRDPNDVDDATQATFLVLARRAAAVRDRGALGGWLHRVAWRAANRLRVENVARSRRHDTRSEPEAVPDRAAGPPRDDVATVLDEEIARLPEAYRVAVLTCYVAGVSTADAAARLGWPKGTVLTRLAWARRRLRSRLAARGVATAAGGFAVLLSDPVGRSAAAVVTARIVRAGLLYSSREPVPGDLVSDRTSSLTEGVVRAMAWNKTGVVAGIGLVVVALLGIGLGRMSVAVAETADGPDRSKAGQTAKAGRKPTPTPDARAEDEDDRTQVAEAAEKPDGPGNDLVVRRPRGSFTREIVPYGKATLTFSETRLRITAAVNFDKVSFTATADADYSINRESMVYGIITGLDMGTPHGGNGAAEIAMMTGAVHDIPFAFRVRTEDDAITVKDLKVGPIGSPIFLELLCGGKDGKEMALLAAAIGGVFKADPIPVHDRPASPAKSKAGASPGRTTPVLTQPRRS